MSKRYEVIRRVDKKIGDSVERVERIALELFRDGYAPYLTEDGDVGYTTTEEDITEIKDN